MRKAAFTSAAILALLSTAQLQAAQTADAAQCLTKPEVQGMVSYMLPTAIDSAVKQCGPHLPADSYLSRGAPRLADQLKSDRAAAWPMARQAFIKLGGNNAEAAMLKDMPEEVVGPIIAYAMEKKVMPEVKPQTCQDIERIAATLEPLPAPNVTRLFTEILMVADRKDGKLKACKES
jgi:hypothetical protein